MYILQIIKEYIFEKKGLFFFIILIILTYPLESILVPRLILIYLNILKNSKHIIKNIIFLGLGVLVVKFVKFAKNIGR